MAIRAIQTLYDGIWFRSRLEARWAVFFNALQVPYEYEPEGSDLGVALGGYLIDFWLPEQGVWVEIKPNRPTESERRKAHALAVSSGSRVCVFMGREFRLTTPHPRLGVVGTWAERFPGVSSSPIEGENPAEWVECPKCGPTITGPSDYAYGLECKRCGSHMRRDTPRLLAAYAAARSARFEHGDRPDSSPA